jgi:hypothetical protein
VTSPPGLLGDISPAELRAFVEAAGQRPEAAPTG